MQKLKIIPLCLLLSLLLPLTAQAVPKDVTITWTMSDTSNVTGYRMYYAYSNTMSNKLLACETNDTAASSLTCPDVELASSPVYFSITAVTTEGELNSSPSVQTFTAAISTVQEFKFETSIAPPPTPTLEYKINFQPSTAPIPTGYLVDSGDAFDVGRGYGWVTGPSSQGTRDRENPDSPDQVHDTMIHVAPPSIWEIALPNGTYHVTVCNGDASFAQGTQNVQAEGTSVIDNVLLSSKTTWVERTATITVSDGRLSITFTGSTDPARLCWLTVTSAN